jgi:hypothetical protein
MMPWRGVRRRLPWLAVALILTAAAIGHAQEPAHPGRQTIDATTPEARAIWARRVTAMIHSGELKLREHRRLADGSGRDEWFTQMHKGVPIEGAEVWRRTTTGGVLALEGVVFTDVAINPVPKLTRAEVVAALGVLEPDTLGPSLPPALVVLPTADGAYALVYKSRMLVNGELTTYFLDATTGQVVVKETAPRP